MVMKRVGLMLLVIGMALGGLTAYRPSEIPADSGQSAS